MTSKCNDSLDLPNYFSWFFINFIEIEEADGWKMAKNKCSQQLKNSVPLFDFLPFLSNGSVSSFSFSSCIVDTEEIFETFYLNSAVFSLWGVSIFMAQKFNFQTSFMILFISLWLSYFCNTKKSNRYGKTSIEIGWFN